MSNSVTPWKAAYQALLSMGFPRQEYQNGLPFHSPGDLDNLEIEPMSPTLATEPPGKPREDLVILKKTFWDFPGGSSG